MRVIHTNESFGCHTYEWLIRIPTQSFELSCLTHSIYIRHVSLCTRHAPHMNETSCTYEWGPHMNETSCTYEWGPHMNETCCTYEWGPHMNETCCTYEWVIRMCHSRTFNINKTRPAINESQHTRMNQSIHMRHVPLRKSHVIKSKIITYEWVIRMCHVTHSIQIRHVPLWMRHGPDMNMTCRTYACVILHIWMRHIKRMGWLRMGWLRSVGSIKL